MERPGATVVVKHKRRSFTDTEANELILLCQPLIESHSLTQVDVVGHLQSTSRGQVLLLRFKEKFGPDFKKKIVDRIRYHVRKVQND